MKTYYADPADHDAVAAALLEKLSDQSKESESRTPSDIEAPMVMGEIVEWKDATKVMPDSDTTVMMICGGDVEAWPGYWDGEQWRSADGMPAGRVIYWADMLEGPLP